MTRIDVPADLSLVWRCLIQREFSLQIQLPVITSWITFDGKHSAPAKGKPMLSADLAYLSSRSNQQSQALLELSSACSHCVTGPRPRPFTSLRMELTPTISFGSLTTCNSECSSLGLNAQILCVCHCIMALLQYNNAVLTLSHTATPDPYVTFASGMFYMVSNCCRPRNL